MKFSQIAPGHSGIFNRLRDLGGAILERIYADTEAFPTAYVAAQLALCSALLACLVFVLVSGRPGTVGECRPAADPEIQDPQQLLQHELALAAEWGDIDEVKAILAEGADPDGTAASFSCLTALEAAAYRGREQVVCHLLDARINVESNAGARLCSWHAR